MRAELERVAELEVLLTERPGHATELVTGACRGGAEAVVVFSGDGGFNEALNGLESDVPIGFLPGGGDERALARARPAARSGARRRGRWRTRWRPGGRAGSRSAGSTAGVSRSQPASDCRRRPCGGWTLSGGLATDVVPAISRSRGQSSVRWRSDGDASSRSSRSRATGGRPAAFVANGSPYTYAGPLPLPMVRDAEFDRGLDLIAPVEVAPLALPSVAARVLSGHADDRRFLREHDLDRIEIRCDVPLPLHVDGEDLGDVEHAVFEAERAAVSVLV